MLGLLYEVANVCTLGVLDEVVDGVLVAGSKERNREAVNMYTRLVQAGHSKEEAIEIVKSVYS